MVTWPKRAHGLKNMKKEIQQTATGWNIMLGSIGAVALTLLNKSATYKKCLLLVSMDANQ